MALTRYKCFSCNFFYIVIYTSFIYATNADTERLCAVGIQTPGYTSPHGDILIKFGDPLQIECVINSQVDLARHKSNTSSLMHFTVNSSKVPPEQIRILNATAIQLHDKMPPKSSSTYSCLLGDQAVCMNKVEVGVEPQDVTDFSCISHNFENLTCTWNPPDNIIKTKYNLTYLFKARTIISHYCPKLTEHADNRISCFWNETTEPQYRPAQKVYYFTLNMMNVLGSNEMNYTFDHYANVLSGPPEKLSYINVTTNSIFLNWSVPFSMKAFPSGLEHRILYQCEYGPKEWKLAGLFYNASPDVAFNLTGIPYAHNLCDIRISLRSANATTEDMWSKNTSINVRTMSKAPGAAPKTDIGSFEVTYAGSNLEQRQAYIYWQQVPDNIKNGEDFRYKISTVGDKRGELEEIHSAYAKYKNLDPEQDYMFEIWSQNSVGMSVDKSVVYIPRQKIREPLLFTKTSFGYGKYELSWKEPKPDDKYKYTNYTLFWCVNNKDLPFQCKGHLNWTVVSSNTTAFNITVDESQSPQFAISANTDRGSSGMIWATCTLIHNQSIGKMKSVWINSIGPHFIDVGWKLDCSDRIMSVEGFIIYYCPILSPREATCKGPQNNVTFPGDSTLLHGRIANLTPYTTYMLRVAVISKHSTYSQPSDPLYNTTLEAAPSSPRNVSVLAVTSTTINITWEKPNPTNGIIKYYLIKYNNNSVNVTPKDEVIKYELTNLSSYVDYHISIEACTTSCSEPSRGVRVTTDVGYPDEPSQPSVTFQNNSLIVVEWERPSSPRGKNDVYEVQLKQKLQYENRTVPIFNVTDSKYSIEDCGEGGKYNTFYISVRAVNIWIGVRYEGPWSPELEYYCRAPIKYLLWVLIALSLAFVILMFYATKKAYYHCQQMRNVEVKLPPGLAQNITEHNISHWSLQKGQEEVPHHSPGDEELLLVKMGESQHLSGDSSGCSSGHESVSSSLESGKTMSSSSDSGTERRYFPETLEKSPPYVLAGNNGILIPETVPHYNVAEEKPMYVQVSDCTNAKIKTVPETLTWPQNNFDSLLDKGYVSIGDAPVAVNASKGYVPHRHFDAKTLKEE